MAGVGAVEVGKGGVVVEVVLTVAKLVEVAESQVASMGAAVAG